MDPCTYKIYHKHGFDSRQFLEHYFSDKPDMVFEEDFLIFPIENFVKAFKPDFADTSDPVTCWRPLQSVDAFVGNCKCGSIESVLDHCQICSQIVIVSKQVTRSDQKCLLNLSTIPAACTTIRGNIRGNVLIDLSVGSMIHHLYAPSEFFKYIIMLKVRDRCILELKRWLNTRTGAFEWGHATKIHVDLEGKSIELQDKEGKVREAAQHVAKCDLNKDNIMDPVVLPPADCIISAWLLDVICKDKGEYVIYLRKFSQLLKPGGHLMLVGNLGMTYFTVGRDKLHGFSYDEDFARKTLIAEGFIIDICVSRKATGISPLVDHKGVLFISAHKEI